MPPAILSRPTDLFIGLASLSRDEHSFANAHAILGDTRAATARAGYPISVRSMHAITKGSHWNWRVLKMMTAWFRLPLWKAAEDRVYELQVFPHCKKTRRRALEVFDEIDALELDKIESVEPRWLDLDESGIDRLIRVFCILQRETPRDGREFIFKHIADNPRGGGWS